MTHRRRRAVLIGHGTVDRRSGTDGLAQLLAEDDTVAADDLPPGLMGALGRQPGH